ncbi:MAG TPA: ATP-dependent sacrificial sulfur transferase LarE [Lentisphaeria bacterium]|nr:MAG: TIGR00268 family protein [Lentisphaerae bacterium GWF2_38_69]HBM17582.1 ATP-dependent sacrificial sulfur transferase LarE [Lentisphaeria bacterium]
MSGIEISESEYKLAKVLSLYNSLAVAFSGGVDSSLLSFMANKYVKGKVLLINVFSPFSTAKEAVFVEKWAADKNYELEVIKLNPLNSEQIKSNSKERCYYCKKLIMSELIKIAAKHSIEYVADGTNQDDLEDCRPGNKAADELGIKHPFLEAGITKNEIREMARENNLENWDRPSSACLASRIPFGKSLEESDLRRIEKAEEFLHQFGFMHCRVRLIGESAKIELPVAIVDEIMPLRKEIVEQLKNLGFKGVFLDLEGYRQGALNEGI